MSGNFRKKIEEIECSYCSVRNGCTPILAAKRCSHINAIMTEVSNLAEGMNLIRNPYTGIKDQCPDVYRKFNRATSNQRTADKAYLKKETR